MGEHGLGVVLENHVLVEVALVSRYERLVEVRQRVDDRARYPVLVLEHEIQGFLVELLEALFHFVAASRHDNPPS